MRLALKWLVPLIFILTLIAALSGVWPAEGTPYPLTNFCGEQVTINARGLYYWDTHQCPLSTKRDTETSAIGQSQKR